MNFDKVKPLNIKVVSKLFDEEYKNTTKLIENGESHLDNLAEGFTEAYKILLSIDPVTATWLWDDNKCIYYCSNCGTPCAREDMDRKATGRTKYCHNCGYKMKEKE